MPHPTLVAAACLLSLCANAARAGTVTIDTIVTDDGNVAALLESSSERFVDAMNNLIGERYTDDYGAIRWEDLDTAMGKARVARVEYRYVVDGQPMVRVYHAMGGEPLGVMASSIFEGPTRPGTPTSPEDGDGWSSAPESPDPVDDALAIRRARQRVTIDADDQRFFAPFGEGEARAQVLPLDDSRMAPYMIDGRDTSLDAEFKALRQIEQDIRAGVVPASGRVDGMLDGAVCPSCRGALERFSRAYGADIRLTQMFPSATRSEEQALVASGRARLKGRLLVDVETGRPALAYDAIAAARSRQLQRRLSPDAMGRTLKGARWRQRSFRLSAPLPRIPEASPEGRRLPNNPDADPKMPPAC